MLVCWREHGVRQFTFFKVQEARYQFSGCAEMGDTVRWEIRR